MSVAVAAKWCAGTAESHRSWRGPSTPRPTWPPTSPGFLGLGSRSAKCCAQFLFQSRRYRIPAAGKGTYHHAISGVQLVDEGSRDMAQPPRDAVTLHRGADGFGDHEADPGPGLGGLLGPQGVHDEIGLHCAHPSADRGPELRRTRHAVPRRKHQRQLPLEVTWESRRQLAPTLAPAVRDDRPACPGAHPQPEAMHARPAPVVRLEGPLALGHGCLLVASGTRSPTDDVRIGSDAVAVGKLVHLASRRGPRSMPGSQPYHLVRATVRGY